MRFPFVSRSVYNDVISMAQHNVDTAIYFRHALEQQIVKYDGLVQLLLDQKKPPTYEPLEPAEPDLASEIWAAIGDRAPINTVAYTQLAHAAMQLQHEGLSPGQIIDRIMQGEEAPI